MGTLPNLIIIGAQKCATTSLHYYLGLHPQVRMSREKELDFFIQERNWVRGMEWYKSNFKGKAKIHGEASPNYTNYPFFKGVPERMRSVLPEVKLIYILRDPVERILSLYIHCYADRLEHRTISEALVGFEGHNPYVRGSRYAMQLERYLAHFSKSQILITTIEDLYCQTYMTLQRIFKFLDVEQGFRSAKFLNIKHTSDEKRRKNRVGLLLKQMSETRLASIVPSEVRRNIGRFLYFPFSTKIESPVLNPSLREKLEDYLKEDVKRLRALTGLEFENWCL
jgi:hypothetical protein